MIGGACHDAKTRTTIHYVTNCRAAAPRGVRITNVDPPIRPKHRLVESKGFYFGCIVHCIISHCARTINSGLSKAVA